MILRSLVLLKTDKIKREIKRALIELYSLDEEGIFNVLGKTDIRAYLLDFVPLKESLNSTLHWKF